jgi:hypothetical protein
LEGYAYQEGGNAAEGREGKPVPAHARHDRPRFLKIDDDCPYQPLRSFRAPDGNRLRPIVHEGLRKNKPVAAPLVGRDSFGIPHQGPGAGPGGRAAEFTSPRTIRFRFRPWAFLMKPK